MKNKLIFAVSLIAMMGLLYKYSLRSMGSSANTQEMVTLQSADGEKFPVSRRIAEQSDTIKTAIAEYGTTQPILLPLLSSQALAAMISIMNELPNTLNIDNLVIEKYALLAGEGLLAIANASMYLLIDDLTHALMRLYIFKQFEKNRIITQYAVRETINNQLLKLIADEEYNYINTSAGAAALGKKISNGELQLGGKEITNVYGLSLVANKAAKIDLSYNKIENLKAGAFKGLSHLQILNLTRNNIKQLQSEMFQGMGHLEALFLEDNLIEQLSPEAFKHLPNLRDLALGRNQLTELQPDLFNGLSSLHALHIGNNKIKKLHPNLFQKLTSLGFLSLGGNPFNPPLTADQIKTMLPNGGQNVTVNI